MEGTLVRKTDKSLGGDRPQAGDTPLQCVGRAATTLLTSQGVLAVHSVS